MADDHPNVALVHYFLAQAHAAAGRTPEGLSHAERAAELSSGAPETSAVLGYLRGACGLTDQAERVLDALEATARTRYVSQALFAQVHLGLGKDEEALTCLQRACYERASDLVWLGVRPLYDELRQRERFAEVLAKLGLAS